MTTRRSGLTLAAIPALCCALAVASAQQAPAPKAPASPDENYKLSPSLDLSSIDKTANPCDDFYKFACGHFAPNHPIPADQASTSAAYDLLNVETEELRGILQKAETGGSSRTPNEQKIGDYYHACMDTAAIDQNGLKPLDPMLKRIDSMSTEQLPTIVGELQRMGVTVFFSYGEQQDYKDASKQIAEIDQGGLGMPEKDFYLRTSPKDITLRKDYVAYVTKILTLSGASPTGAATQADGIMKLETELAKASMGVTERRDPDKVYHLVPVATVADVFPQGVYSQFEEAVHSPKVTELNDTVPAYLPAMVAAVSATDLPILRAYLRFHLIAAFSGQLPHAFDQATFDFYGRDLTGTTQQRARWKRCSSAVNHAAGEALGQVYVKQYFPAESKAKMLQMVGDIEHAMGQDLDQLDWMSPETKVKAHEKLAAIANKIGYPDHWRDYTALTVKPEDAVGNSMRANAFENDRELNKIGKPVDHGEWGMTPPTVNAYYDPSMNDINFPAGILQPNFYDPKADDALNYGHIGAVIGHELTHGFDDEGKKFDAHGNLSDWWTPADTKRFEAKTDCLVKEYSGFKVGDQHINGQLTLGENTADNGGLLLAYLAYMTRARQDNINPTQKFEGYTQPQQFYIAWAQNWCANERPEAVRTQVLTNEHSPDKFRSNGPIVNQPAFASAFGCKAGSPMVPANSCRVW